MGDVFNINEVFGDETTYKKYLNELTKEDGVCEHKVVMDSGDFQVCTDCGDTKEVFSYDPEWRYYGVQDNRAAKDPSRCRYSSNTASRTIKKALEVRKISDAMVESTIKKYETVVGKKTMRGEKRNGIIAICLWVSLREIGDFRTVTEVGALFNLERKNLYKGLQTYSQAFPGDRTITVTPSDLLTRTIKLAEIQDSYKEELKKLCLQLENKSRMLGRSNPQSVAAAIVWLFLCLNPDVKAEHHLSKTLYAKRVSLSEITISKLAKESLKKLRENSSLVFKDIKI
jgi:transcription initiation factor TFIIIB Brf1 subunit/transcription initiation factor TFIIB